MATLEDYRESSFVTRALETFAAETPGVKNVRNPRHAGRL